MPLVGSSRCSLKRRRPGQQRRRQPPPPAVRSGGIVIRGPQTLGCRRPQVAGRTQPHWRTPQPSAMGAAVGAGAGAAWGAGGWPQVPRTRRRRRCRAPRSRRALGASRCSRRPPGAAVEARLRQVGGRRPGRSGVRRPRTQPWGQWRRALEGGCMSLGRDWDLPGAGGGCSYDAASPGVAGVSRTGRRGSFLVLAPAAGRRPGAAAP